jgi:hypothetical protein
MLFEITALPTWNNIFTHPVLIDRIRLPQNCERKREKNILFHLITEIRSRLGYNFDRGENNFYSNHKL